MVMAAYFLLAELPFIWLSLMSHRYWCDGSCQVGNGDYLAHSDGRGSPRKLLLPLYNFTLLTGHKVRLTDLILNQLVLANSLVFLPRGILPTMGSFRSKHFLNEVACKLCFHRVARKCLPENKALSQFLEMDGAQNYIPKVHWFILFPLLECASLDDYLCSY